MINYAFKKTSGDFPIVLYEVVSKRSSVIEGSLSVDDLNEILDELSKNMGKQYGEIRMLKSSALTTTQRATIKDFAACL